MASILCRPAWLVCEGILFAALAGCGAGTDNSGGGGHAAGCVSSALVVCTKSGQVRGAELALSEAMMGYWLQFAATGDPNGSGALQWTPYHESSGDILQLDDTIASMPGGYRIAQMKFLSTLPIRGF